jgi:hypothetical protein
MVGQLVDYELIILPDDKRTKYINNYEFRKSI